MKDPEHFVRREAARRLGEFEDQWVVDVLITALRDPNDEVRRQAAFSLKRLRDPKSLFALYELWEAPGCFHQVLEEALDAAREVGLHNLHYLAEVIGGEDYDLAAKAASVLGEVQHPRAVELLLEAIHHPNFEVNVAAGVALARHNDSSARQRLLSKLDDSEEDVRADVAFALAFMDEMRAYDTLMALLKSDDSWLRMKAVHALGTLHAWPMPTSLLGSLYVKLARVLGRPERPRQLALLVTALQDEHDLVRRRAAWALGFIGQGRWPGPKIDASASVRPLIHACLNDPSPQVRAEAAHALGQLRSREATAPLLQTVQHDEDINVRINAAYGLGDLEDPTPVEPLIKLLKEDPDPRMRAAAAGALGELRDKRASQPLRDAMLDDDPDVRLSAYDAWIETPVNPPV